MVDVPPRILVLGATGMLGHRVFSTLSADSRFQVIGTIRDLKSIPPAQDAVAAGYSVVSDAADSDQVRRCLEEFEPTVVLNCVGVIKQSAECADRVKVVELNGLLPHKLADFTSEIGARLIHVSTDCVFSGSRGTYTEADNPDPSDFYGRSKLVGEPSADHVLTLRTSIIGHERKSSLSLVDWFLSQSGTVPGFTNAIYSGVTTNEFARFLSRLIVEWPYLSGLYHLASRPISKYELLELIRRRYDWRGDLVQSSDFACDRSLSAEKLRLETGYTAPDWAEMIDAMHVERAAR